MTRRELENKMTILLAGRAAETLTFQHLSTGAADDINRAADIARRMATRYGMDANLREPVGRATRRLGCFLRASLSLLY